MIITSKTALPIRILHAEQEGPGGLGSWDLSVFRYPRSEKFHKTSIREQVRRLELKFRDEDGRCSSNTYVQAATAALRFYRKKGVLSRTHVTGEQPGDE